MLFGSVGWAGGLNKTMHACRWGSSADPAHGSFGKRQIWEELVAQYNV